MSRSVTVYDLTETERAALVRWVALDNAGPGSLDGAAPGSEASRTYWAAADAWGGLSLRTQIAHTWAQDRLLDALRSQVGGQFAFDPKVQDTYNFASVVFPEDAEAWRVLDYLSKHDFHIACERVTRENLDARKAMQG